VLLNASELSEAANLSLAHIGYAMWTETVSDWGHDLERDLAPALTSVAFGLVRGTRKSAPARPALFFSGFE
jgi:hypothetical protein